MAGLQVITPVGGADEGAIQAFEHDFSQAKTISCPTSVGSPTDLPRGLYRFSITKDIWYVIGTAPTAVKEANGSVFMPAGAVWYEFIPTATKISIVADSSAGFLCAVPATED